MGTWLEKIWPPSFFSNFLRNPPNFFGIKYGIPKGFNFWCFDGHIIVGDRPYPKLWGKYKKPKPRFHRFCYKNALKNDFFTNLSQVSVIFIYYCLILLYIHDFELKQRKQILKISFQFSMGFHSKIYEILAWAFCIFPIPLGKVDL